MIIQEFLASLGFRVDDAGLRRFQGTLVSTRASFIAFSAAVTAAVTAVEESVRRISAQFENLFYLSQRTLTSARDIEGIRSGFRHIGLSAQEADATLTTLANKFRENPAYQFIFGRVTGSNDPAEGLRRIFREHKRIIDQFGEVSSEAAANRQRNRIWFGLDPSILDQGAKNVEAQERATARFKRLSDEFGVDQQRAAEAAAAIGRETEDVWDLARLSIQKLAIQTFPAVKAGFESVKRLLESPEFRFRLDQLGDKITEAGQKFRDWLNDPKSQKEVIEFLQGVEETFIVIADTIKGTFGVFKELVGIIKIISDAAREAGKAFRSWAFGDEHTGSGSWIIEKLKEWKGAKSSVSSEATPSGDVAPEDIRIPLPKPGDIKLPDIGGWLKDRFSGIKLPEIETIPGEKPEDATIRFKAPEGGFVKSVPESESPLVNPERETIKFPDIKLPSEPPLQFLPGDPRDPRNKKSSEDFDLGPFPIPKIEFPKIELPKETEDLFRPGGYQRNLQPLDRRTMPGFPGAKPDTVIKEEKRSDIDGMIRPVSQQKETQDDSFLVLFRALSRWWSGDSAFRPLVSFSEEVYTKFSDALLNGFGFQRGGEGAGGDVVTSSGEGQGRGMVRRASYGGQPRQGETSREGRQADRIQGGQDLPKDAFEAIAKAEGTYKDGKIDYNAVLADGALGKPDKPLTDMTLAEVKEFQGKMLDNPNNKWNSSAVGAFQIVRTTLNDMQHRLGLKDTDKFDEATQQKLASEIHKQQGSQAWEGFKKHEDLRKQFEDFAKKGMDAQAFDASKYSGSGGTVSELQQKEASIRRQAIQKELKQQLEYAGLKTGVNVEVTSGGQPEHGRQGVDRTGGHRHDHGGAADLQLRDAKTKELLDFRKPEDRQRMQQFLVESMKAGATGIGAGLDYMGAHRLHVGGGAPGYWGAGGKEQNAPDWVANAFMEGQKGRLSKEQVQSELSRLRAPEGKNNFKAASDTLDGIKDSLGTMNKGLNNGWKNINKDSPLGSTNNTTNSKTDIDAKHTSNINIHASKPEDIAQQVEFVQRRQYAIHTRNLRAQVV
jgi:hypothetical protein